MLTVNHLLIIAHVVMVAVTLCEILTRPKMVLGQYGAWLDRLEADQRFGWMAYPIGYCAKCTAGNMALWVFVARSILGWEPTSLALIRAVCFVSTAVLLGHVATKLLHKIG